jgi:phage regulator Rha-like protein
MSNIVQVTNGTLTTTTEKIAAGVGYDHEAVIKLARKYKVDLEEFGLLDFKSESTGGRPTEYAILNEEQSSLLLTYMRNGPVVRQFKKQLVRDFWTMRRQLHAKPDTGLPTTNAKQVLQDYIEVGQMLGVPTHIAQVEGVKGARLLTGVDFSPLLLSAPAQDNLQDDDRMLEPADLGKLFGVSGTRVNQMLAASGYQVGKANDWHPTELGKPISALHHWTAKNKSGYNYKWRVSAVSHLFAREAA